MKSCLIVDDSGVVRKIIRQIIEPFGFQCSDAENGKVAKDLCEKASPDLIMLDWNMPVMNGLEFLKSLKAMNKSRMPVVIFCTTENDMDHVVQALDAGASDYIMKPFDGEIIKSKLEQNGLI